MRTPRHDPTDRTDADNYERSPSTGAADLARILHATAGADHTPTCDTAGCARDAEPVTVVDVDAPDRRIHERSLRCRDHARDALGVSS